MTTSGAGRSLDGVCFRPASDVEGGEVDPTTIFRFHEEGGVVWAEYSGGAIRKGFLVGTRRGQMLKLRYVQLNDAGETSSGRATDVVEIDPDGRLRLRELWEWESKEGSGTSTLVEVGDDAPPPTDPP
ncbi:MAG TPA: hypothetical protein VHJ34_05850 [Actinomycetota bacterium]|nr:hypothetical protein [Actinomycetota bacterium]